MNDGFIRIAAGAPRVHVADPQKNTAAILDMVNRALAEGVQLLVLPELCITGYTLSDLFLQHLVLDQAKAALLDLTVQTADIDMLIAVGLPVASDRRLYNCAALLHKGTILGIVPKCALPNYAEFYEARHFATGFLATEPYVRIGDQEVPFGPNILFECENIPDFIIGMELCEDLWTPLPQSTMHTIAGATVALNLSASNEVVGKREYRESLVKGQSGSCVCAYIYASAGEGESTTDVVFPGHLMIAEDGRMLAQCSQLIDGQDLIIRDIDLQLLMGERRRIAMSFTPPELPEYTRVYFTMDDKQHDDLHRMVEKQPFVPNDPNTLAQRCEEILAIQTNGLKRRMEHTGSATAVVAVSGGLDSTLALLVAKRAVSALGKPSDALLGITMPGLGTTGRTYQNALQLMRGLGANVREINIAAAVDQHFKDIGQDSNVHDVVFENSQARERTQIAFDIANQTKGVLVGTGDLSELALGWTTYGGDHISNYGVNAGVPKTLVRHLIRYIAELPEYAGVREILLDILDTPVSPELLPAKDDKIVQCTEDIIGPYELHDFFLYNMVRFGFAPSKVYFLARHAFGEAYTPDVIKKWMKVFYSRFFSQQFKRSCLPDGPKVGSVALSPRGDWRMPSDANARLWLEEVERLP